MSIEAGLAYAAAAAAVLLVFGELAELITGWLRRSAAAPIDHPKRMSGSLASLLPIIPVGLAVAVSLTLLFLHVPHRIGIAATAAIALILVPARVWSRLDTHRRNSGADAR